MSASRTPVQESMWKRALKPLPTKPTPRRLGAFAISRLSYGSRKVRDRLGPGHARPGLWLEGEVLPLGPGTTIDPHHDDVLRLLAVNDPLGEVVLGILEDGLGAIPLGELEAGGGTPARLGDVVETVSAGFDPQVLELDHLVAAHRAGDAEHQVRGRLHPALLDQDRFLHGPGAGEPGEITQRLSGER